MIRKLLFFFLIMATAKSAAQTLTVKGKAYPATDSWDFICERYALSGTAKVQVAKSEKGGILQLSVASTNPAYTISGTVYVFLADNTTITCSDKGIRDATANELISYYVFSAAEMHRLKTTEIRSIHFNIKGNGSGFNSQVGNFTAINRKGYFSTAFDKSRKSYDTTSAISKLYQ
jgi:hypothetical protein